MSSLASLLAQWLGLPTAGPPPRAPAPIATDRVSTEREYPLAARGLPAIGVAEVMAPHANWLHRLRDAYGAEESIFAHDIGSVVERYAQFVHLLPATRDSHFRHAGGLFRMGIEIAFYALQASDGAIFSGRQTLSARSTLEPRWRYAAFLAGLCSELHRPLSHLSVRNEHGAEWPAYEQPLARWLQQTAQPALLPALGGRGADHPPPRHPGDDTRHRPCGPAIPRRGQLGDRSAMRRRGQRNGGIG